MVGGLILLPATFVLAGPVYQPPGTKLTYGDVTHGQRVQSASSNPAAAAADLARGGRTIDAWHRVLICTEK